MALAVVTRWLVIAALSQAPAEPEWLKVIPADVDAAIHVRGIDATRDDLVAMLKAMNPDWGKMAEDAISGHLAEIRQRHGEIALKSPFVGVFRIGPEGFVGPPPFVVLLATG